MKKKANKKVWGKTESEHKNLRIVWLVTPEQRKMLDELVEWSGNNITWWLNEVCSVALMGEWAELWEQQQDEKTEQ